jgi:ABC-type amino acid transport system permease subunit
MDSELLGTLEERVARRTLRMAAIEAIGPLTMLAGVIWAIAQPYRLAILHPHGKGFYDWLAQPPLLVVLVGVFFAGMIAPGIIEDLRGARKR